MALRLVKTNLSPSSAGAYSCRRLAVNALSWQVVSLDLEFRHCARQGVNEGLTRT